MNRPIYVVYEEGGYYHKFDGRYAPIRIYKDRRVQDDIVTAKMGKKWRNRFTRSQFRHVRHLVERGQSAMVYI